MDRSSIKPSLVFHVGMPKTGSSYLQSMFALNRELLSQNGFVYPVHPNSPEAELGRITIGNFPGWRSLEKTLNASGLRSSVTVFSSELLFGSLSSTENSLGWQLLKRWNRSFSVKLVLFIRDPIAHAISQHQQFVKRGGMVEDLDEWIRTANLPSLEDFISAAKKNVDGLEIINFSKHEDDLWERTLRAITWSSQKKIRWVYPTNLRVNRSLSAGELRLQVTANTITGWSSSSKILSDQFCNSAPDVEPAQAALSQAGYAKFVNRISSQVARVNQLVPAEERLFIERYSARWAAAFKQNATKEITLAPASWAALVAKLQETSGKSRTKVEERLACHLRKPAGGALETGVELVISERQLLPLVRTVRNMAEPPVSRYISGVADRTYRRGRKWLFSTAAYFRSKPFA